MQRGVVYKKKDEVDMNGSKVLRANNISLAGKLILDDIKQINKELTLDRSQKLLKNDIFICLSSGSKEHIGKVSFIDIDTDYYFGGFMGAVRVVSDSIYSKYLYYFLRGDDFNNYLRRFISGANINNLSSGILNSYRVLLPSIQVQKQLIQNEEKIDRIIEENQELIQIMENRIDNVLKNLEK